MRSYYYEVEVLECGEVDTLESIVGVGFCSQFFALDKMPGWPESYPSWGYHGDDGQKFKREYEGQGHHYSESYGKGDIIGAGVDFDKQELFFTKNGEHLVAFCKDNGDKDIRGKLFPIVGMCPKGVKVKANFGTNLEEFPFKYGMVAERKDEEHQ
ncbi:Ran-binding protein 9 [Lasiodiplodia theobromae]|uniref:Ran-binding protein 9 n=1 Tax=Lasiodiplodia theobromae TaxID=45133 RepID=UPI0015C348C9|nr:Ran-binding protein 9 [Lasiodiplodia theobromae]KAF4540725.1 Ran-binding protein 9 [Lasiodiplodia theobromae]